MEKTNTLVDAAYDAAYKLDLVVFNNATNFKRAITQEAVAILATAKARKQERQEWLCMLLDARQQFALAYTTGSLARYKADVAARHDISQAQLNLDKTIHEMIECVQQELATYSTERVKPIAIGILGCYEPEEATLAVWEAMVKAAVDKTQEETQPVTLLAGGSAWADHVAVHLFLTEPNIHALHLYLPAKWETTDKFFDTGTPKGYKSNPGGFLNKKHEDFSAVIDRNSLAQIGLAKTNGALVFDSYADPTYRYTAIASLCDKLLVLGTTPEPPATIKAVMDKCRQGTPATYINVFLKQTQKRKAEAEKSAKLMNSWLVKKPKSL